MGAGLTEKQRRFCDEYLVDLNGTRAYMAVYPSVKKEQTASVCAAKLLRNAKVLAYLRESREEQQTRVQIRQDDVLRSIKEIAEDVDVKPQDRLRALELLGKHLGLFDRRKDELDRKEQEARIKKLEREAAAEDEDSDISVNIMGMSADEIMEAVK